MVQKKISQLTAAEALAGTEVFAVVQGGATDGGSIEQIREYVASQPNVFSVTQRIEDAAPALQFSENDTVDQNWEFIGVAGALRLDELNDAFSTTGTHHTFTHGGGTQFGSPTGGDQGAGTVNATGLYQDGVGVPTLDGAADANFTAMPQVGGDPIVESGGNADGEFTRWANGTQHCTRRIARTLDTDTTSGNIQVSATQAAENFSAAFVDVQYVNITLDAESGGAPVSWVVADPGADLTLTAWPSYRIADSTSATGSGFDIHFFAAGSWK